MDKNAKEPVAAIGNGVSTPLFADGVVLQAEDLTLGQSARNAELARMRAMLHGWGVVAGLIPQLAEDTLAVTPGYGVLPGGGELYLPTPLSIPAPTPDELAAHCGTIAGGCELPTGDETEAGAAPGPVWLAVGAGGQPAAPRGVILAGCEHPANAAHPTRWCHQVRLYLLCELPESHQAAEPDCKELAPYVCGDPPLPVPLPDPPDLDNDLLVLGRLVPKGETVSLELADRQALLPHHVLQAWARSCLCPVLAEPEPEPNPRPPKEITWKTLLTRMLRLGMDQLPAETRPDTVLGMFQRPVRGSKSVVERLMDAEIPGPAAFLRTDRLELLEITGTSEKQLVIAQKELAWIGRQITF